MDLFPKTFLTRDSDPSTGTVKCRQQVKKVVPILLRLFEILEPATDPFFFKSDPQHWYKRFLSELPLSTRFPFCERKKFSGWSLEVGQNISAKMKTIFAKQRNFHIFDQNVEKIKIIVSRKPKLSLHPLMVSIRFSSTFKRREVKQWLHWNLRPGAIMEWGGGGG